MNEGRAMEEEDSGPAAEIPAAHSSAKRQQTGTFSFIQLKKACNMRRGKQAGFGGVCHQCWSW